ncbi:hypothetical protein CI754_19140 [Klebsiella quasipneumoniae subsp. similipneumoniae]|nr:hypothetical protein CI754_19140 [Klebsiella quasipneumoniae subsp. similipneumoniae]
MPGGGCALPGLRPEQPVINLSTCATETAGAGRSPEVQGAAATGRPLCAPGTMSDIAQKKYGERNLPGKRPGVVALLNAARAGTFPVAPIFRRVAAAPYPAYRALSQAHTP